MIRGIHYFSTELKTKIDVIQRGCFKKRMCEPPESELSINALIHMNRAATFASLYTIVQDVQGK